MNKVKTGDIDENIEIIVCTLRCDTTNLKEIDFDLNTIVGRGDELIE